MHRALLNYESFLLRFNFHTCADWRISYGLVRTNIQRCMYKHVGFDNVQYAKIEKGPKAQTLLGAVSLEVLLFSSYLKGSAKQSFAVSPIAHSQETQSHSTQQT